LKWWISQENYAKYFKMSYSYIVKLSHQNFSLAYSEFRAILDSEEMPYETKFKLDEFIIFDSTKEAVDLLLRRAALAVEAGTFIELIDVERGLRDIVSIVKESLDNENSCVEIDSIRGFGSEIAKALVDIIGIKSLCTRKKKESGMQPIKIALIANIALIYRVIYRRRQRLYSDREPHKRPCYRPGTMKPVLARLFVNLSRVSSLRRELVLDPFCGVGGFAIEACLMGLRSVCCDVDENMVMGARINIEGYDCHSLVDIARMDAGLGALASYRVDGIATDPPYGIQSVPRGYKSLIHLMSKFIENAYNTLKNRRFMVFAVPLQLTKELDRVLTEHGFEIKEKHIDMVHGSLTRTLYVVKKNA